MKNTNLAEKIGFVLIMIGFVFLLLENVWIDNPIPEITKKNLMFGSAGLLIWALGRMKKEVEKQKETDQPKLDSE